MTAVVLIGYVFMRIYYDEATVAIEAVEPAKTGFLGGLGLPIISSWIAGGFAAAGLAWLVGRISLGLRSDYFAIATLGISEIMISILKNEDWLSRGVKNVTGLDRPVPYEVDLQKQEWFINLVKRFYNTAEDGIRDVERSRGLGDVYKRQVGIISLGLRSDYFAIATLGISEIMISVSYTHLTLPTKA